MGEPRALRREARNLRRASNVVLAIAASCFLFGLIMLLVTGSPANVATMTISLWTAYPAWTMRRDAKVLDIRADLQDALAERRENRALRNPRTTTQPPDQTGATG